MLIPGIEVPEAAWRVILRCPITETCNFMSLISLDSLFLKVAVIFVEFAVLLTQLRSMLILTSSKAYKEWFFG